jgi:hypothetical protein
LDKIIDELRLHNEDLARLSRQIRELATERASQQANLSKTLNRRTILRLSITRQASKQLYGILANRWACGDGIKHTANMSLEFEGPEYEKNLASKVRFNLAMTCTSRSISEENVPLWLKIESEAGKDFHSDTFDEGADLIAALEDIHIQGTKGDAEVTFASNIQIATPPASSGEDAQQPGTEFNLSTVTRLCRHFHANILQKPPIHESCIGFLEDHGPFKHFIYPDIRARQPKCTTKSISLQEILEGLARQGKRGGWIEKFRLARLLTLAVLNFWSTPWLKETWSSSDVHFLNLTEGLDLRSPCLVAPLSTDVVAPVARNQNSIDYAASTMATNAILFNLGVALLELGYDAPLQSLRQPLDVQQSASGPYVDFFTAKRLGEQVYRELNSAYGRIVKRCLICDFGAGNSLDSIELQNAVVIHVVYELDRCLREEEERGF